MTTRWHTRHIREALIAAGLTVACIALAGPAAQAQVHPGTPPTSSSFTPPAHPGFGDAQPPPPPQAQEPPGIPLTASNFTQAAPRGFGDQNNSWAQSMVWWQNHLYVGTNRDPACTSIFAIWLAIAENLGADAANNFLPYPPVSPPGMPSCAPGVDLPLQAEIWRWTPGGTTLATPGTWTRVFQSPQLNNPGASPTPAPPQVMWQGKKIAYDIAFRGLAPFTEPNGKEALYAFGTNIGALWNPVPPPRILRSTDGITFTPVPQTPGTFLGDLNQMFHGTSSFRSPVSFNGKLFVLASALEGQGVLIASADPAKGDNAWFLASPQGMQFYDLEVFNGWLYLGGFTLGLDPLNPLKPAYTVVKTKAQGTPPYELIPVVPSGAYLTVMPSQSVVSMNEYFGRLYVGTAGFTEVIRINPDDTWDLVVGSPRAVPLPNGGSEPKYPLSGLDAGWGDTLNDHAWQMGDANNELYIGTFNASSAFANDPVFGPLLRHNSGAHLYRSHDGGWYYSTVTTNGFSNPSDPHGGLFDYGIRTMAATPYGFFLGTTNDSWGLAIFRGTIGQSQAPAPPERVEIEPTTNGSALLSWKASPAATQYRIWRAERNPILARDSFNIETFLGFGGKITDVYVGRYVQIGVSQAPVFIDSPPSVQPGHRYMYYVQAVDQTGKVSDQSNLVAFPLLTPPVTFAQLLHDVDLLDQRHRFLNPAAMTQVRQEIIAAQTLAASCHQISQAISLLDPQVALRDVLAPDATDLEIRISKLVRRLQLFNQFPTAVSTREFCTHP